MKGCSSYTIGCAALGAMCKSKAPVIGRFLPGILHGDGGSNGSVPKVAWIGLGLGIVGLTAAAIYNTAKG
jgi:hypothetical protein